jgi:hypothetical protein
VRTTVVAVAALAIVALTPSPASATPRQLVSKAQWAAVRDGMTLAQVQKALGGKRLYLDFESTFEWYPSGTAVMRTYSRTAEVGDCYQDVSFTFDNISADLESLGPMTLDSKSRFEFGCSGVVK